MRAPIYREKFLHGRPLAALLAAAVCLSFAGCQAQIRGGDRLASDPHWEYADASLAEQDLSDAREALVSEEAGEPTTWQGWNDRGIVAARSSEILTAEAAFREAGSARVARYNLARLYVILGEDAEAGAVYRQTLRRGQLLPAELRAKALQLESQNRRTEARLAMRAIAAPVREYRRETGLSTAAKVRSQNDAIAAALWLAGDELRALRYGPARDLYDQVLSVNPQNAAALFGRGYISYLAEDWGGAVNLLQAARLAGSLEPELPYYLVRALHQQQRYDDALKVAGQYQKSRDLRLLELHGRLRLLLDYRAKLGDLIQRARPADRDTLRNRWYGAEDLRRLPELDGEFRLLY